jgi:beta-lactamase class A
MRSGVLLLAALILGMFLGATGGSFFLTAHPAMLADIDACGSSYDLINPWLRCEPDANIRKKKEFSDFKVGLQQSIDEWVRDGRVSEVSVYLRDLQFGPWMGIGEEKAYSAASLLKLPILFAVLKEAQLHPEILQQRVQLPNLLLDYTQEIQPRRHIEVDGVYTIQELIEYMMIYSDNDAKEALDAYITQVQPDAPLLFQTMEELGFAGIYRTLDDGLSVKQVSSMFRILYNSSYLTKEMSQRALELLARSDFQDGIVAGVPAGTMVAHKFGEREYDNGEMQLHDCGIVYYPSSHYLLCVMTRGREKQSLASVIADVSRMIYAEMETRSAQ